MTVKPTIHKIKSHMTVAEALGLMLTHLFAAEWPICNEAGDAVARAYADHLGKFEK